MKPKTKIQRLVVELNEKIPKIDKEVIAWAYVKLFKGYALKTQHTATCFECGHNWKLETTLVTKLFPIVCPNCKKELEARPTKSWTVYEEDAFRVMTVFQHFQVIRVFKIRQYCRKGQKADYYCHEIYQHWISEKGKLVIMAIEGGFNSFYSRSWIGNWYGTAMEVRGEGDRYFLNIQHTYPKVKILNVIRRNGFKGHFHGLSPTYLFRIILSDPKAETLLKAKQYPMLSDYKRFATGSIIWNENYRKIGVNPGKITEFWQSIKICIRNNYIIKNPSDWFDYLSLLNEFGKDLFNAKYVCPADFHAEHQRYIEKPNAILEKKELERLLAKVEKSDIIYQKEKGRYLNINISDGELSIIVIPDVRDFYIEGKRLHHCIFTNSYYAKKDSLILSARIGDKRLETIELSLKDYKILQSRGLQNKDSQYHKRIVKLLYDNIQMIKNKNIVKRKKKTKQLKQVA